MTKIPIIPPTSIEAAERQFEKSTWLLNWIKQRSDVMREDNGLIGKSKEIMIQIYLLIERGNEARKFIEFANKQNSIH